MKICAFSSANNAVIDFNGKADTLVSDLGLFDNLCSWILRTEIPKDLASALKFAQEHTKSFRNIAYFIDLTTSLHDFSKATKVSNKHFIKQLEAGALLFANGLNLALWLGQDRLKDLTLFGKEVASLGLKQISIIFLTSDLLKLGRTMLALSNNPDQKFLWVKTAKVAAHLSISMFYAASNFNPALVAGSGILLLTLKTAHSALGVTKRYLMTDPLKAQPANLPFFGTATAYAGG